MKTLRFLKEKIYEYEKLGYRAKRHIKFYLGRIFLYFVLIELAFLFILPFIYIFTTALKTSGDYLDPTIKWIPTSVDWNNFTKAFKALNYFVALRQSFIISVGSSIGQIIACGITGYGIGRYKFKGRNLLLVFVILALLIPPQTMILSSYGIYAKFRLINTIGPVLLPSILGHGLRGALFVLIYMYFFQRIPDAMEDAARIDGAGPIRLFVQIMLPLVKSAIIIVGIFSFVWHWNDNYEAKMYLTHQDNMTLQPRLELIRDYYSTALYGTQSTGSDKALTEPTLFAGCLLVLLPVLIVYIIGQKHLAAGIERIGVIE